MCETYIRHARAPNTIGMPVVACSRERARVATVTTTSTLRRTSLCRGFRVAFIAALCPAILDGDGATFDPTEFAQPLRKSGGPSAVG